MKNLSRTLLFLSLGVTVIWVVGCSCWGLGIFGPYDQNCAEIEPGSEVSTKECDAVKAILRKYDKSLYQIRVFDAGNPVATIGTLTNESIPGGRLTCLLQAALEKKLTGCAIHAGQCTKGEMKGGSSTNPIPIRDHADLAKLEQVLKNNQGHHHRK
jgi:hypothetical protein